MRTRDEHKESLIRQKTIELVVANGLDGFSMQKLSKAAGVSPATLYIYYKDREDLILKISSEISNKLLECSLNDFSPDMSLADGLRVQWKNRMEFFLAYPQEMQFIEQIRYSPIYDKVFEQLKSGFREIMGKFVHRAIQAGELQKLPFEVFWSVAYAPLYQLIKFHSNGRSYANERFAITDETIDLTLTLVLKALKP